MKRLIFLITAILFNSIVGGLTANLLGFSPLAGAAIINGAGMAIHFIPSPNIAMAGLAKEIWLPDLMENFYPDWSFLKEGRDMSAFVENDTINLAEVGVEPEVLINTTSYPVPFAERTDIPLSISLDVFDTEGTVIRNAELYELAYDKRTSVTTQHKNALQNKFAAIAAYNWSPSSNDTYTPVLPSTGGNFVLGANTFKKLSFDDILNLRAKFNLLDVPEGQLVLVLNPIHEQHLWMEDKTLYKSIMGDNNLLGFKIYRYSKTPVFAQATDAKKAFGAAAAATDQIASFCFVGGEVMKALGTFDMFERLKDPEQKGDIINFQMRGKALPLRNKYMGAIFSDFVS